VKNSLAILWMLAGSAAVIAPAAAWRSYIMAHDRASFETTRLTSLRKKGDEIVKLRAASPRWSLPAQEAGSLAPKVTLALSAAGVAASALASLSPQSQTVAAPDGTRLLKRSAALTLTPIKLPELGAFLEAWRTASPGWVVALIDVSPDAAATTTPGADLPLRVNLTLESLAAEDAGGTP